MTPNDLLIVSLYYLLENFGKFDRIMPQTVELGSNRKNIGGYNVDTFGGNWRNLVRGPAQKVGVFVGIVLGNSRVRGLEFRLRDMGSYQVVKRES